MTERLVGVYDGKQYRNYPTTTEFLRAELSSKNRGAVFFAHAGGMADIQFILDAMLKRNNKHYRLRGYWSGSSLIICTISQGKNNWTFVDSYWLLRDSLAKIGKSIGLDKGGQDYHCSNFPHCGHKVEKQKPMCIFYSPMGILKDYNALDCRILHTAIQRFEDEVWSLGGHLRMTVASTAMMLFRSAYLMRDIPTTSALNKLAREAYVASRVEVIQRHCENAEYYDINSSFPYSMTKPQPGRYLGLAKRWKEGDRMAMVKAKVTIPDWTYIPPVPIRVDKRVYFPVGSFERWFMGEDLELILDTGGSIDRVDEVLRFEPFDDMNGYVSSIYEMRRKSEDDFQRLVYKYLMNSLYGKFGEGTEKSALLINPKKKPPADEIVKIYRAGVYQVRNEIEVKHSHVPIAANITASSRALITKSLQQAAKGGSVFYCDTDSIVTTERISTGDKLGEMKHEKHIERGTFLAPKLYRLYPGPQIRAKGFRSLDTDEFDALAAGNPVTIERMVRVRENFSKGNFSPCEAHYIKRTIGHMSEAELIHLGINPNKVLRPKRALESDGNTRPWDYSEL